MRRWLLIVLVAFACAKREAPVARAKVPSPAAPPRAAVPSPAPAGDGYDGAVRRFRESRGFKFDITAGDVRAVGEMARPRPGMERVTFQAQGARWVAEAKPNGVVWTKDGKPEKNEPAWADRIYQWVTIYFDPEKTPPQTAGDHLRFTDRNGGEVYDVWIAGGEITRVKTNGSPAIDLEVKR